MSTSSVFIILRAEECDWVTMSPNSTSQDLTNVSMVDDSRPIRLGFVAVTRIWCCLTFKFVWVNHFWWGTWIFSLFRVKQYPERFDFMRFFFWNHMIFVFFSWQINFWVEYELVFFFPGYRMSMRTFSLVLTFKIINYKLNNNKIQNCLFI